MTIDATRGPRPGPLQPLSPQSAVPTPAAPAPQAGPPAALDSHIPGPRATEAPADDPAASATAAAAIAAATRKPAPDKGQTWGGPHFTRDLNFGHTPGAEGDLVRRDASGTLVWGDNGKAVTPAQWANMPAAQRDKLLKLAPGAAESLTGGDPAEAHRPEPAPEAAADPERLKRLRAGLGNANLGGVHQCFAYAWATTNHAGGKPLGQAREDALYKHGDYDLADLPKLVADGKISPGDIVYANTSPGADYSSTNLAYGPHWFVFMGEGRWADQYGVKTLAEMQATVPGRKLDTLFHPF